MANEFPKFKAIGLPVRVVLYAICMLSYFSFFYPILMGHVGPLPFWLGLCSSLTIFAIIAKFNRQVLYPALAVHIFFVFGYYTSLIPPVPVAVKRIGVYYEVIKQEGKYLGKHQKSFFDLGANDFYVRPGDKVNVLLSIFSPAAFKDQIFLKWYFEDNLEDTIPLTILGGRQEGFRGFGTKQFYRPGSWKVEELPWTRGWSDKY